MAEATIALRRRQTATSMNVTPNADSDLQQNESGNPNKNALANAIIAMRSSIAQGSQVIEKEHVQRLPTFLFNEFDIGRFLGRGGFYDVFEIRRITLSSMKRPAMEEESKETLQYQENQRQFLSANCQQGMIRPPKKKKGAPRPSDGYYAIKCIRKIVVQNEAKYITAVKDSVTEVFLLASLDHSYILKIRGTVTMNAESPHPVTGQDAGYLIIMDRLFGTLTEKFEEWRDESHSLCFRFGNRRKELLLKKLKLAFELSQALKYLHQINIMYRDIKQDNIGFDVRGAVKVFDFGLAKELREHIKSEDGLYKLSMAGTLRYMSPEILRGERYNMTVDVYSYGVLMWEIFSLKKAFEGWPYAKLLTHAKGHEADLDRIKSVPDSINTLIGNSLSFEWTNRPSFKDIVRTLQNEFMLTDDYLSRSISLSRSMKQRLA